MPDIDANKRKYLLSVESLYSSCAKVGGASPDLGMSLREFLESYGWNGVAFCVLPEEPGELTDPEEAKKCADTIRRLMKGTK